MDRFLDDQSIGKVVDTKNSFTMDRSRSRRKLLDSIPKTSFETLFRLLDSAAWQAGFPISQTVYHTAGSKYSAPMLCFTRSEASVDFKKALLEEIRRPFGPPSAVASLARAIFLATGMGGTVVIRHAEGFVSGLQGHNFFCLSQESLEVDDTLPEPNQGGIMVFFQNLSYSYESFKRYSKSVDRALYSLIKSPHQVLPLESMTREVSGYFDYRTKPFTAIRSYVRSEDDSENGLQFDFWDGMYSHIDEKTLFLERKEKGKFLFLRWRPNYGRPTFLQHCLNGPWEFGTGKFQATFWIETTDRSAEVSFFSQNMVSDPVKMKGPAGLKGLVLWPDLKYDLWGTRLVEDEAYQKAFQWTQTQVDQTARVLSENLNKVVERLAESNLIKGSYKDETIRRIQELWS
ncbi:MAG TPA: hypothetical protein EYO33_00205 [Phycisphaerales bacterium]|nr:hypothetical protein [Phycisphaerales bacterium]